MRAGEPRKKPVVFYRTRGGSEIVRESNSDGLSVCRCAEPWATASGRFARTSRADVSPGCCFCLARERIVVLHGLIKKTRKTPDEELALARKRKKEFEGE